MIGKAKISAEVFAFFYIAKTSLPDTHRVAKVILQSLAKVSLSPPWIPIALPCKSGDDVIFFA